MNQNIALTENYWQVADVLKKYIPLWYKEVLSQYSICDKIFQNQWINELQELPSETLWKLDAKWENDPNVQIFLKNTEVGKLFNELWQVEKKTAPPLYQDFRKLPKEAFLHVKPKKRHELEVLYNVFCDISLEDFFHKKEINYIIDVGGGVGHTSRILAHYFFPFHHHINSSHHITFVSLDNDLQLQKSGSQQKKKFVLPANAQDYHFIHHFFDHNLSLTNLNIQKAKSLFLGLHSCGQLSLDLFHVGIQNLAPAIFNFPCCYQRLSEKHCNLSKVAKDFPLPIDTFCLTLAAKAHRENTPQNFYHKEQVKKYRYALHLLMIRHGWIYPDEFVAVGESQLKDYYGPFSTYALSKLEKMNLAPRPTADQIEQFYSEKTTQEELRRLFLCNMIRWQFGRLLELAVLYDRALFFAEQGLNVELRQYFDEIISPRNIGILATR